MNSDSAASRSSDKLTPSFGDRLDGPEADKLKVVLEVEPEGRGNRWGAFQDTFDWLFAPNTIPAAQQGETRSAVAPSR